MNTAWDDFNPRAGETHGLSSSVSSASFGNGFHQTHFYQGDHRGGVASASTPDFCSLTTSSSLNETMSSVNGGGGGGGDPFGADAFNPVLGTSTSIFSNQQNVSIVLGLDFWNLL